MAQIAHRHLEAETREAVERILGPGEFSLARAATWPDEIRSDPRWNDVADWHYMTVEDGADWREEVHERTALDSLANVAEAIHFFAALLEGDDDKLDQLEDFVRKREVEPYRGSARAAALALLVHFVGDIHQPLHVGRGGDLGGNRISVNWFQEPANLHSVWDSGLIEQQGLGFSEAARMIDHPTAEEVEAWRAAPVGRWIEESMALRDEVYDLDTGDTPSARSLPLRFRNPFPYLGYGYAYRHTDTVERRLLMGGVRLAGLLDSILR